MSKPINDLLVVVQELKDCIKQLKETNLTQNEKLERHRKDIDGLKIKVKELETKINMYHGE
jgi:phage shock protein A